MMKQLAVAVRATAVAVPGLLRDLAGLSGVGLVAYGAWLIYPPVGFIVGGSLLILGALLLALGHRSTG
ncbi:hypothetical protein [Reyranella sp.]|uniref:hypothetical protein n=1 Tax=Reyranella sp. TaxID=1929291 RepID=UPI003D0DFB71